MSSIALHLSAREIDDVAQALHERASRLRRDAHGTEPWDVSNPPLADMLRRGRADAYDEADELDRLAARVRAAELAPEPKPEPQAPAVDGSTP